ncbi:hypothetical protein BKA69DRAFT_91311 [Paraphysoderma sedebokerense]|nr:hypothetical protein BKA69DRAFT_91311 [Paraphysoderma sedebokerense]
MTRKLPFDTTLADKTTKRQKLEDPLDLEYLDTEPNDQDFEAFENWLSSNGADLTAISFKKSPHGYGVFAKKDLSVDDVVAFLPSSLIMSEKVALSSPLGQLFLRHNDSLPESEYIEHHICTRNVLFAFLVYSYYVLQKSSHFYPYLRCLPRSYDTLYYWNDSELSWLEGTNLKGVAKEKLDQVRKEWELIRTIVCPDMIPFEVFSFERFLWARCSASSRAFPCDLSLISNPSVKSDDTTASDIGINSSTESHATDVYSDYDTKYPPCKSNLAMWPLFDMLNHCRGLRITWDATRTKKDGVFFNAGSHFSVAEEVFNNYGAKSNDELLLSYGFCLPTMGYLDDYYPIKMNFSHDPLYDRKSSVLSSFGLVQPGNIHIIRSDGHIPSTLLSAMEIILMNQNELDLLDSGKVRVNLKEHNLSYTEPVRISTTSRAHIAALATLLSLLESKQSMLTSNHTYLETIQPPSSNPLDYVSSSDPYRFRMAKLYVAGQYYIISQAISKTRALYQSRIQSFLSANGSSKKIITVEELMQHEPFVEWFQNVLNSVQTDDEFEVTEDLVFQLWLCWCCVSRDEECDQIVKRLWYRPGDDRVKDSIR